MVSVGKLSAGQARYYLDQAGGPVTAAEALTSGVEDYYLGGPEAAGRWLGRGARALGLDGRVAGRRASTPCSPATARSPASSLRTPRLGRGLRRDVLGAEERERAVRASATRRSQARDPRRARARRRGGVRLLRAVDGVRPPRRGRRRARAGRRAWSRPRSGIARRRAGDPQLHTHVLVANLVRGPDGRWSALDGRLDLRARPDGRLPLPGRAARGAHADARRRVDAGAQGLAEIRGVSEPRHPGVLRRRAEIEAAMELPRLTRPHAAQVAALDTRRAKDRRGTARSSSRRNGGLRAARLGLREARIGRLLGRETLAPTDWTGRVRRARRADRTDAERTSTFRPPRRPPGALPARRPGARRSQELERAADAFLRLASRSCCSANGQRVEPRYSTVELVETEQRTVATAVALRGAGRGVATADAVQAALTLADRTSPASSGAMVRATHSRTATASPSSSGRRAPARPPPLGAAREAWQATGIPVRGGAIARKAAHELGRTAGIAGHERRGAAATATPARARHRSRGRRGEHARHPRMRRAA